MEQVISDPWVLKIVEEGLSLKFVSKPPKSGVRTTNLLNIEHMSNILEEVKKLSGSYLLPFVDKILYMTPYLGLILG
jgi:hypothetical protein